MAGPGQATREGVYRRDDRVPELMTIDGRTLHYGSFYGLDNDASDSRPMLVVWGNCQAEALRIVLDSSPGNPFRTVRVPPVHELTASDLPHVERLLGQAGALVTQPVRAGYRELPIGTADVAEMMPPASTRIVWPVIRYAGLYPWQIIVRHPSAPSAVPPGVPYHDLRTVLAVRDARLRFEEWDLDIEPAGILGVAERSIDELKRREQRDCDIGISDVLRPLGAAAANTINHPGNAVLIELGSRILAALDVSALDVSALDASGPSAIDRELLGGVRAPLERRVIDALELDSEVRTSWMVEGTIVDERTIHRQQMSWYATHPEFIDAALTRYAELIDTLGLST